MGYKAIIRFTDQFDEIYDQFIDEISTDAIEEAEREFTRLVKNRIELWGGAE